MKAPGTSSPLGSRQDFVPIGGKPVRFVTTEAKRLGVSWGALPFWQPLSAAVLTGASGGPVPSLESLQSVCLEPQVALPYAIPS